MAAAEAAPSPAVVIDGPVQPPASDAPRSRVLPVVPDIMPDAVLPGAPALDSPAILSTDSGEAEVAPDRDERRIRGRRLPLTAIFLGVTLLAAAGIGLYFAKQTGVFKTPAQLDTAPPEAPPTVEDDDFTPPAGSPEKSGEDELARDWINVFSPADPTHVSAPSDAKAEVMRGRTGPFLRIRSGTSGCGHRLRRRPGHTGTDRRQEGGVRHRRPRRGGQGDADLDRLQFRRARRLRPQALCGRQRARRISVRRRSCPDKPPGAGGTIAINSDFAKQGKAVDIYEISVSVRSKSCSRACVIETAAS